MCRRCQSFRTKCCRGWSGLACARNCTEEDAVTIRSTRMQNANKFKLGLFGMNCSGSFATLAPERWQAGWDENLEAAKLADEAGLEFILPIARWIGYGGRTDRQGTSFE